MCKKKKNQDFRRWSPGSVRSAPEPPTPLPAIPSHLISQSDQKKRRKEIQTERAFCRRLSPNLRDSFYFFFFPIFFLLSAMASVVRSTALRAGGACVRCRKGKTKCVYENGRAPCKNCAKGMHECYLPSESMGHGGHGVSPARVQQRSRESLPSERSAAGTTERQGPAASSVSRHVSSTSEK